jgi:hypothetical protein
MLLCQIKYPEAINLKIGLMVYAFDEMNVSDANAAIRIWMEANKKSLIKKGVKKIDVVYQSYDNLTKLEEDLRSDKVDVFSIKSTDFFNLKNLNDYSPFFIGTRSPKSKFDNYILVTNKNSGYKDITEIVNEKITSAKTVYEDLSVIWAKIAIIEANGKKIKKVINFDSAPISESKLLLGVFFGKYKCAVVSKSVYDVVCELNPKVKTDIIILATSDNLISSLFARKNNISKSTAEMLEAFGVDLNENDEGRLILNLFKIQSIEKTNKDDIEETRKLIQKYKSLYKTK